MDIVNPILSLFTSNWHTFQETKPSSFIEGIDHLAMIHSCIQKYLPLDVVKRSMSILPNDATEYGQAKDQGEESLSPSGTLPAANS